jgi:hypothetical protein
VADRDGLQFSLVVGKLGRRCIKHTYWTILSPEGLNNSGESMLLSELVDAIYGAGYDFKTVQEARRYIIDRIPEIGEEIMDQPLSVAQANPRIPEELGLEILAGLNIPVDTMECP